MYIYICILFFRVIINLFQIYDDPLQMVKEKYCLVFEYYLGMSILLPARRELRFKKILIKRIF